ncbi:hypothetical protein GCM10009827_010940 [Dactylosporangium maewongense]|uniref:Uncharacterized protein n=1 Tax=Dactylosporangium maewongense TaxID=634393 RepID=A0ABN1ZND8_9ACTN
MLDFEAVADVLSDLTGRAVARVVVDDEEWKATAIDRGMPPQAADFTLDMFRAARRGEFAVTDPTLETVIGRPAVPARTVLETMAAAVRRAGPSAARPARHSGRPARSRPRPVSRPAGRRALPADRDEHVLRVVQGDEARLVCGSGR